MISGTTVARRRRRSEPLDTTSGRTGPLARTGTDETTRLITALGPVLGWAGVLLMSSTDAEPDRQRVVSRWLLVEDALEPADLHALAHDSAMQDRVLWRGGDAGNESGALAVPVRVSNGARRDGVEATLCIFGPHLRSPDAETIRLLETVAELARTQVSPLDDGERIDAQDTCARAISLVDVFAYTVAVGGHGALEWRYLGPNSEAVVGHRAAASEPLSTLVAQHAHPDEADAVAELERALVEGLPLDTTIRFVAGDGAVRWVSWRTRPRWVDGTLHADGVATDVSARVAMERSRQRYAQNRRRHREQALLLRQQAVDVRDANDNVLQRIFAAGLRLQMLTRTLDEVEAHAATAIAFQLDQAATDLREVILTLDSLTRDTGDRQG